MRFVHTADWQLGMTRYFLNGEAQPRYSAARRDVVAGLGALAAEAGAEFVVVAGDVFEHNQLAPRVVSQSLEAMRAIGVPVYLLPGNHDPLDASSVYTSALFTTECPDNVTVLDRAGVHEVRPGLEIVAAPWTSKAPTTDLVAEVLDDLPADGTIRIVVGHGAVDIFVPDKDRPSLIGLATLEAAIARGAVHYVALGDKHSRMQVGTSGRIWYSGSPEVTNYDDIEPDPGHVLVVDVDDDIRVGLCRSETGGRWRFVTLHHWWTADGRGRSRHQPDLMPTRSAPWSGKRGTGSLTVTDKATLTPARQVRAAASRLACGSGRPRSRLSWPTASSTTWARRLAATAVEELVAAASARRRRRRQGGSLPLRLVDRR
jgi:DNA repair exonuclease SbcCD nuclease subunit